MRLCTHVDYAIPRCRAATFQENTFELFGLDFLMDGSGKVWLLEVNADPSLAVFGERLRPRCAELIRDTLDAALPSVVGVSRSGVVDDNDGRDSLDPEANGCLEGVEGEEGRVGGFRQVLKLPPRFRDGDEGRRRVGKLMSLMGSLAASTYTRSRVGRTNIYTSSETHDEEGAAHSTQGDTVDGEEGDDVGEESTSTNNPRMMVSVSLGAPGSAGAAAALKQATSVSGASLWEVTYNPKAPCCAMQWAPHRAIRWERVMDQQQHKRKKNDDQSQQQQTRNDNHLCDGLLVANHYYSRAGLLRRVELSTTLASAGVTGVRLGD